VRAVEVRAVEVRAVEVRAVEVRAVDRGKIPNDLVDYRICCCLFRRKYLPLVKCVLIRGFLDQSNQQKIL